MAVSSRPTAAMYYPRFGAMGGGELHALHTALALAKTMDVVLVGESIPTAQAVLDRYDLDISSLRRLDLADHPGPARRILGLDWQQRRWKHSFIRAEHRRVLAKLGLDVFINFDTDRPFAPVAPHAAYFCFFPGAGQLTVPPKGLAGWYHRACELADRLLLGDARRNLVRYQTIVGNSAYTASWVERLWHTPASVIWPPCHDMGPASPTKKPWIVCVGRFHAPDGAEHSKSQDRLLEAFALLDDRLPSGHPWEFHLVGDLNAEPRHREWFDELNRRASGRPVVFHPNASFDELRDVYRSASMFWIATGFGFDPEQFPEKQEHFGMVTVEAMSAGAVPLARASGGSLEIIVPGESGMHWNTLEELAAKSEQLILDEPLRQTMSANASQRARNFLIGPFEDRVEALAQTIMGASSDGAA